MHAKDVMKSLLSLVESELLPQECFILYWYLWSRQEATHTYLKVAKAIARKTAMTSRKYVSILVNFRLIDIDIQRSRGIEGFKAKPLKVDEAKIIYIKEVTVAKAAKIKASRDYVAGLIDILTDLVPKDILPKKWNGPQIQMIKNVANKVPFRDYVIWFVKYKAIRKSTPWFSRYIFGCNNLVSEYQKGLNVNQKVDAYKKVKDKSFKNRSNTETLLEIL